MPSIEKHCEISWNRTGNHYLELHKWMDADPNKKAERHDLGKIYKHGKMMEKKYGPEGLQEYLQHIRDDFLARFNSVREIMDKDLSEALAYLVTRPQEKAKFGGVHRTQESEVEALKSAGISPDDIASCLKVAEKALDSAELVSSVIRNARSHWEIAHQKLTTERILGHLRPFAPSTVQRLIEENPQSPSLGKREGDVSVLFLDIAGYTKISETHTREQINFVIEKYFSHFIDIIYRHDGDINETAGDGLMAIFQGPPEKNAFGAVTAAMDIRTSSKEINQELKGRLHPIEINMGINSGIASVGMSRFQGNTGTRMTFSATGPVTNLAARIAAAAKHGDILVGPETAERVKAKIKLLGSREMKFKNVADPVLVYTLVGKSRSGVKHTARA